jgi:hypothetical protein
MTTIGSVTLGGQNGAYRDSRGTSGRAFGADIECLDRIYLNAYVPTLQSSGQVVAFMTQHLGKPIPSPALMEHIGTRFRKAVESCADANEIPWVRFGKDDRKISVMQPHIEAQAATGKSGVAAIGVAQEFQYATIAEWQGSSTRSIRAAEEMRRPGLPRQAIHRAPERIHDTARLSSPIVPTSMS